MVESSFGSQELVNIAILADRTCSGDGCSSAPIATYARVRHTQPGKVAYEVIWTCDEDLPGVRKFASEDLAEGSIVTGWFQEIVRTCLRCGDPTTQIAFVARDYEPGARRLEAMSLCDDHAAAIRRDLGGETE